MALRSVSPIRLVWTGQSMNDSPAPPFHTPWDASTQIGVPWYSIAHGGEGWTYLLANREDELIAQRRSWLTGVDDVLVMNGGQGDMIGEGLDGQGCYDAAKAYAEAARDAGYPYIVGVVGPDIGAGFYGFTPTQLANWASAQALYASDPDGIFDVVVDCSTDPLDDATDLTYFMFDELHLNPKGRKLMATRIATGTLTLPPFTP